MANKAASYGFPRHDGWNGWDGFVGQYLNADWGSDFRAKTGSGLTALSPSFRQPGNSI
jgi:hypothetical protein